MKREITDRRRERLCDLGDLTEEVLFFFFLTVSYVSVLKKESVECNCRNQRKGILDCGKAVDKGWEGRM